MLHLSLHIGFVFVSSLYIVYFCYIYMYIYIWPCVLYSITETGVILIIIQYCNKSSL